MASTRSCGFDNEVGMITFSFLAHNMPSVEETQQTSEMLLSRAVSLVRLKGMEDLVSNCVMCRCVKSIEGRGKRFLLVNCIVRIQTSAPMLHYQKYEMLRAISRNIVTATPEVVVRSGKWLERKILKEGFILSHIGLILTNEYSLKLALKTMSFVISHSVVPECVKFHPSASLMLNVTKWMVITTHHTRTTNRSSIVTNAIMLRSDLKKWCPEPYWPVFSQGLCYAPCVRETCDYEGSEKWYFHIHTPYKDERCNCKAECNYCRSRQPIPLFHIAQMAVMKVLFERNRARILNHRKSPFF